MRITQEASIREGKEVLKEKGLLNECQQIAGTWTKPKRVDRLDELGWEAEYMFRVGKLRPRFDAFKSKVGFDHEKREQMNVRSHLLMMEAAHQQGLIDAGVFAIPAGNDASVRRTAKELKGEIFTKYFPLQVPLYLIEYSD